MRIQHYLIRLGAIFAFCLAGNVFAQSAGVITHLTGTLTSKSANGANRLLSVKSMVSEGDVLTTHDASYARMKFVDGAEVVLRPDSQMTVTQYRYKAAEPAADASVLSLFKGGMRSVTGALGKRNPDKVNILTNTATIGIRGTHFGMLLCSDDCGGLPPVAGQPPENGLHIDVAEGAIRVSNPSGEQIISAGQFAFVRDGGTPPVIVPPGRGIVVTMPQSISRNNASSQTVGRSRDTSECAVP